jgi:Ca2+-binding EF-hand superfamily protein
VGGKENPEDWFSLLDQNGDERLTTSEFKTDSIERNLSLICAKQSKPVDTNLNFDGFSALDRNGDGFFDSKDIPLLFKKFSKI